MSQQPLNFLLITSDQQRWDAIGASNPLVKTPNLDRLLERGMVFDRAYTPNPTCTPARCSILTGHFASKHGCYTIGTSLPEDYPNLPSLFSKAGYFTGLLGKGHFNSCLAEGMSEEAPPFIQDLEHFREWHGPWYGFDHVQLCIGHSTEKHAAAMHYGAWLEDQGVDRDLYFGKGCYLDYGTWDIPEKFHNSTWTANVTIDAIERSRSEGKPFCLWSSFQDPHNPCMVPEPWASMYRPEDMPVYANENLDDLSKKPKHYQDRLASGEFGPDELFGGKNWHCLKRSNEIDMEEVHKKQEIMAKYYGMVSLMDHHIGRIIDHLQEHGQWDNTVVVFTTDHGDYMGSHDFWWKGLPPYEDIQRLPFIVSTPDCETVGGRSNAFQNLVDIYPTFLAMAGIELPVGVQGAVQSPTWINKENVVRDWSMTEFRPSEAEFAQKTFVYDRFKLVLYSDPTQGELYDLSEDPDQHHNLWSEEEMQSLRAELFLHYARAEMERDGTLRSRLAPA